MKTFACTHKGFIRKNNEDRYLIKEIEDGSILLIVADGMGGVAGGDIAAEIVRDKLATINNNQNNIRGQLSNLVKDANRIIFDKGRIDPALEGMGTTVTCSFLRKDTAYWVHVGDSRLYLLRNRELIQLTRDQNMAQFLIEEGEITSEEAQNHHSQNQLDQCVGCDVCVPDTGSLKIKKGDLLLLATDGLHGEINNEALASTLISDSDIKSKALSLVDAALDAGGKDNITVIIIEI